MPSLHVKTPCIPSAPLSDLLGGDVYLKLDLLQASGSFKDRGMLALCGEYKSKGVARVVSSSGGNAGLAVACSGRRLGMEVHVVVPETTKPVMIEKIRAAGATCEVAGANWNEADAKARRLCEGGRAGYCHPFDHPTVWTGHSSIVDELAADDLKPDAIVVVSGGGGLLCGIFEGLQRHSWTDVAVIPVGAQGADAFAQSFNAGKLVTLPGISSVCTSMGALCVTPAALQRAQAHGLVTPVVVSDRDAVDAVVKFANDHRMLVEPACGAALSVIYSDVHRAALQKYKKVVVIVCGGNACTLDLINGWREQYLS
ncbi:L-serine dehydratase [Diplonema papillatum]|nr:L-serine dehydratase [Diplonema papillatum]